MRINVSIFNIRIKWSGNPPVQAKQSDACVHSRKPRDDLNKTLDSVVFLSVSARETVQIFDYKFM